MSLPNNEALWMQQALREAETAFTSGERPVGAAIVDLDSGQVLARGYEQIHTLSDFTALACMIALSQLYILRNQSEDISVSPVNELLLKQSGAIPDFERPIQPFVDRLEIPERGFLGIVRLAVVTTIEPDLMSLGALLRHPEIRVLIYGVPDARQGACVSMPAFNLNAYCQQHNRSLELKGGILQERCEALLQRYERAKSAAQN